MGTSSAVQDSGRELRREIRGQGAKLFRWAKEDAQRVAEGRLDDPQVMPEHLMLEGPGGASKSWSILCFLIWCAQTWPGIRVLIVRQTRASLVESACQTLEKILTPGHPMLKGADPENRQSYRLGESKFVLGSMEHPDRLYSTDWDIVYVQEASQISFDAWDRFARGMRNESSLPFSLLIGDTNPHKLTHWIKREGDRGKITMLRSLHIDNPAYFVKDENAPDGSGYRMTPLGRRYMRTLSNMSGVRRKRLYEGVWCSAEGAIWPEFDMLIHGVTLDRDEQGWISKETLHKLDVRAFYGVYDWGHDHPGVFQLWAYAGNNKRYRIAEVYRRRWQIDQFAEKILELHEHYPTELIFCGHDRPDAVDAFNDRLGASRTGPGQIAVKADNAVHQGIECVRRLLSDRGGGPYIFFDRNAIYGGRDEELADAGKPWCTEMEIDGYVYKKRKSTDEDDDTPTSNEEPDKKEDDGCDCVRMLHQSLEHRLPPEMMRRRYGPGTMGSLMRHDEVFGEDDPRSGVQFEEVGIWEQDADEFYGRTTRKVDDDEG